MSTKELPADVCKHIVCDDKTDWNQEPVDTLEKIVDDEMSLANDQDQSHVGEAELAELESVLTFLKTTNEPDESNNVEHETDESVMRRKR